LKKTILFSFETKRDVFQQALPFKCY